MDALGIVSDVIINNGGGLEKIIPSTVVETSTNVLTITFTLSQTSHARLIAAV